MSDLSQTDYPPFHRWTDGLTWGEETLSEQRDRILKEVLPHIYEQHQKRSQDVTEKVVQLSLF